jgi:hypothetical protein
LKILHNRNFVLYSSGNIVSWIGLWMQRLGIGWLSWDLTHSAVWVGVVSMAQFVPIIALGPFFGVLADQVDRKRYAITVQVVQMIIATLLWLAASLELMSPLVLLSLCAAIGVSAAAHQPVRMALVNDLVPRELLHQAITLNSVIFNASRFVGPALGGVAISTLGVSANFGINAISYLAVLWSLSAVTLPPPVPRVRAHSFASEFSDGIRYVMSHAAIGQLMLVGGLSAFFARGAIELLPAFADAVFGRGSAGLASLTAAAGAGAIAAGLLLSRTGSAGREAWLAAHGSVAAGAVLALLGLVHEFVPGVVVVGLLGFATTLCSIGMQVELQSTVDNAYRGRVVSLWGVVTIALPSVGGTLIGSLSHWPMLGALGGLSNVTFGCGLACAVLAWLTTGELRRQARRDRTTSRGPDAA